jgi:hypothetical protein
LESKTAARFARRGKIFPCDDSVALCNLKARASVKAGMDVERRVGSAEQRLRLFILSHVAVVDLRQITLNGSACSLRRKFFSTRAKKFSASRTGANTAAKK